MDTLQAFRTPGLFIFVLVSTIQVCICQTNQNPSDVKSFEDMLKELGTLSSQQSSPGGSRTFSSSRTVTTVSRTGGDTQSQTPLGTQNSRISGFLPLESITSIPGLQTSMQSKAFSQGAANVGQSNLIVPLPVTESRTRFISSPSTNAAATVLQEHNLLGLQPSTITSQEADIIRRLQLLQAAQAQVSQAQAGQGIQAAQEARTAQIAQAQAAQIAQAAQAVQAAQAAQEAQAAQIAQAAQAAQIAQAAQEAQAAQIAQAARIARAQTAQAAQAAQIAQAAQAAQAAQEAQAAQAAQIAQAAQAAQIARVQAAQRTQAVQRAQLAQRAQAEQAAEIARTQAAQRAHAARVAQEAQEAQTAQALQRLVAASDTNRLTQNQVFTFNQGQTPSIQSTNNPSTTSSGSRELLLRNLMRSSPSRLNLLSTAHGIANVPNLRLNDVSSFILPQTSQSTPQNTVLSSPVVAGQSSFTRSQSSTSSQLQTPSTLTLPSSDHRTHVSASTVLGTNGHRTGTLQSQASQGVHSPTTIQTNQLLSSFSGISAPGSRQSGSQGSEVDVASSFIQGIQRKRSEAIEKMKKDWLNSGYPLEEFEKIVREHFNEPDINQGTTATTTNNINEAISSPLSGLQTRTQSTTSQISSQASTDPFITRLRNANRAEGNQMRDFEQLVREVQNRNQMTEIGNLLTTNRQQSSRNADNTNTLRNAISRRTDSSIPDFTTGVALRNNRNIPTQVHSSATQTSADSKALMDFNNFLQQHVNNQNTASSGALNLRERNVNSLGLLLAHNRNNPSSVPTPQQSTSTAAVSSFQLLPTQIITTEGQNFAGSPRMRFIRTGTSSNAFNFPELTWGNNAQAAF